MLIYRNQSTLVVMSHLQTRKIISGLTSRNTVYLQRSRAEVKTLNISMSKNKREIKVFKKQCFKV